MKLQYAREDVRLGRYTYKKPAVGIDSAQPPADFLLDMTSSFSIGAGRVGARS
jgi:hypothetical protein